MKAGNKDKQNGKITLQWVFWMIFSTLRRYTVRFTFCKRRYLIIGKRCEKHYYFIGQMTWFPLRSWLLRLNIICRQICTQIHSVVCYTLFDILIVVYLFKKIILCAFEWEHRFKWECFYSIFRSNESVTLAMTSWTLFLSMETAVTLHQIGLRANLHVSFSKMGFHGWMNLIFFSVSIVCFFGEIVPVWFVKQNSTWFFCWFTNVWACF